jgi:hypothetical protein
MSRKTPTVAVGYQDAYLWEARDAAAHIRLDTPAWVAWLEEATTTRFAYPICDPTRGYIVGYMTVRKERRQRGGTYWAAFRRCGCRVRKVYLGSSATLTHTRLAAIAHAFHTATTSVEESL